MPADVTAAVLGATGVVRPRRRDERNHRWIRALVPELLHWTGTHGIYGEDIYVLPEYRRHGVGRALLREMAAECVRRGYGRLEFAIVDWNTPTIAFIAMHGAKPLSEWTTYRISGEESARLGGNDGADSRAST